MKFLFWILALFAAAVAVTLFSHNPGYVQVVYPPYRMELSLSLFVLLVLAWFVLAYFAVRLMLAALRLPKHVRDFRHEHSLKKARHAMLDGLQAFFEGRYAAAEKSALQAMELGDTSRLNPIIAARAAHALHEFDKRDTYLEHSSGRTIGDDTMRLLAQHQFTQEQQHAGNRKATLALLTQLEKRVAITPAEAAQLRQSLRSA
jgi:HemY protein